MTPIEAAFEATRDRMASSVTLAEFEVFCRGWRVFPVHVGDQVAGAVLVQGPEIHACVLPWAEKRWLRRWALELINLLIDEHGYAQTHAATEIGKQFVARMGFQPHGDTYRRTEKWDLKH